MFKYVYLSNNDKKLKQNWTRKKLKKCVFVCMCACMCMCVQEFNGGKNEYNILVLLTVFTLSFPRECLFQN